MDITSEKAKSLIEKGGLIIIDVRTPAEFNENKIADSILIDIYSDGFKDEIQKLDKEKTYLVYCRTGSRSAYAVRLMETLGFIKAYNLDFGILDWISKGYPVE